MRYPRLNIIVVILITIFFGICMLHIRFDTSLSAFIIRDDPDMASYNRIKEIFETEETVFIGFSARDLFSKEDLKVIEELTGRIEEIDYVRNVRSLTNANLVSTTPDSFEIKALVGKMPETHEESIEIKRHATTNYLYMKDLSSSDGKFGALLVNIENLPGKSPTEHVVGALKAILREESKKTGFRFYLGGDAIINHSLGEYMKRDALVFMFPMYLILILLLIITVGRPRDIVISLCTITMSLIWTMGSLALMGKTLNNVTLGIMPLVLCIALEDIYYIHNHYYNVLRSGLDKRQAMERTLAEIAGPCFFTSFTTVVGFASLLANEIKPIIDFSIVGSVAVMLAFVIAIIFIPSVHIVLRRPADLDKRPKWKINPRPLIENAGRFVRRRQGLFWVLIPALFIVAIFGVSKIKIETDHLSFFHKQSEVYRATKFIEKNLGGVSNLELTLTSEEEDQMKEPDNLKEVEKLAYFLRGRNNVDKALSIVDFLKDMNRAWHDYDESAYNLPDTRNHVAQYMLIYSMSPRRNDVEKDFVDYNYRVARILCRLSEHNSTVILELVNRIKSYISENIKGGLKAVVTSYPVIYSNMLDSLVKGQVRCLILVFFSLFIVTSAYFKSLKIGLLAMIPNVMPIMFILGLMGYAGITLNVATAMTTGIAIGLAMNDTTHFFTRFKQRASRDGDYREETTEVLHELGEPMMYSSFLMMAGYLVLMLSQFRLTVFFGMLCALTIFIALLCDLFITPWILITFKPRFK